MIEKWKLNRRAALGSVLFSSLGETNKTENEVWLCQLDRVSCSGRSRAKNAWGFRCESRRRRKDRITTNDAERDVGKFCCVSLIWFDSSSTKKQKRFVYFFRLESIQLTYEDRKIVTCILLSFDFDFMRGGGACLFRICG